MATIIFSGRGVPAGWQLVLGLRRRGGENFENKITMRTANRKPGKFSVLKPDPVITKKKFRELEDKLERLKKTKPSAMAEVARLAELGDFSENVEYQMAKGRLRGINNGIINLENQLHEALVVGEQESTGIVQVGSVVTISHEGKEKVFKILGSVESDPKNGVISYNSPIGAALMGASVGEKVSVKLANREVEYRVVKVE